MSTAAQIASLFPQPFVAEVARSTVLQELGISAEDALSEVYARLLERRERELANGRRSFPPEDPRFFRFALFTLLDLMRTARRRHGRWRRDHTAVASELRCPRRTPEAHLRAGELRAQVHRRTRQWSEESFNTVLLRLDEGLSHREIAGRLGRSHATIARKAKRRAEELDRVRREYG